MEVSAPEKSGEEETQDLLVCFELKFKVKGTCLQAHLATAGRALPLVRVKNRLYNIFIFPAVE